MLFMGTALYPDENGWGKHLARHGGSDNGETEAETTVFYFDVHPDHLQETLRRFGSFFACPLFKWSGARREVKAIDSEFEQAAQDDHVREWQVLSALTQPGHPYHRFGWGNKRSLVDEPREASVDIGTAHLVCRPTELIGHLLGHEGSGSVLAVLKQRGWATDLAAGVSGEGDSTSAAALFAINIELSIAGLGAIDTIVGVVCGYLGLLSRSTPPEWLYSELRDVAALHFRYSEREAEIEYARRLAISMQKKYAPADTLSGDVLLGDYQPELVDEAIAHMTPDKLLLVVSIKQDQGEGPGEGEGMVAADAAAKDSSTGGSSTVGVADGADAIAVVPAFGPKKQPQRVGCFCTVGERCGRPDHVERGSAKAGPPPELLTERWFGSKFQREQVTEEMLDAWRRAYEQGRAGDVDAAMAPAPATPSPAEFKLDLTIAVECNEQGRLEEESDRSAELASLVRMLHLPVPNPFIPSDFTLCHPKPNAALPTSTGSVAARVAAREPPVLLHRTVGAAHGGLFWKPDRRFFTPKAFLWLTVQRTQSRLPTVEEVLIASLAAEITLEQLNEESYAATVAGLAYVLEPTLDGFALSAAGFSHKLAALMIRACEALAATLQTVVDVDLFERAKQKLQISLANSGHVAADRAHEARLECIELPHFTPPAQLAALSALTPKEFNAYMAREWQGPGGLGGATLGEPPSSTDAIPRICTTALAHGNVSAAEASRFYSDARRALGLPPDSKDDAATAASSSSSSSNATNRLEPATTTATNGCTILADGPPSCYRVVSTNASETNNAIELYWQLGPRSIGLCARLDLLSHLMYEPLFNQLRTREQLGYSVACGVRDTGGVMGFAITVTSAHASPCKIEARALRFVRKFLRSLRTMRPATFCSHVEAAVTNKLRADVNLSDESFRLVSEIQSRQYLFDRAECEATEMRVATQAELSAWGRQVLLKAARRLSVHAYNGSLPHAPERAPLPRGAKAIQSADDFREPLAVHRQPHATIPPVQSPA